MYCVINKTVIAIKRYRSMLMYRTDSDSDAHPFFCFPH